MSSDEKYQLPHGDLSTYTNHRCRCALCREANRLAYKEQSTARRQRLAADFSVAPHGTTGGYRNWGCRCLECIQAQAEGCRTTRSRSRRRAS